MRMSNMTKIEYQKVLNWKFDYENDNEDKIE